MKIAILLRDNWGACEWYRLILPFKYLEKKLKENNIIVEYLYFSDIPSKLNDFDLVYTTKHAVYQRKLPFLRGGEIVCDIDDDVTQHPHFLENYKKIDVITTTNSRLKNILKKFNNNIHVFENSIPHNDDRFKLKKYNNNNIGYLGHNSHNNDITLLRDLNRKLYTNLNDKYTLTLYGYETNNPYNFKTYDNYIDTLTSNRKCFNNFHIEKFVHVKNFFDLYENVAISLAPLVENNYNYCKSNLKFIEAALSDTFFIGTDLITYSDIVVDGYNGFLIKRGGDFSEKIIEILKNKNKYRYILENAKKTVIEEQNFYNIQDKRLNYILNGRTSN